MFKPPFALFTFATLVPVVPLLIGAVQGGIALWLGLAAMTLLVGGLDHLGARKDSAAAGDQARQTANRLSLVLAAAQILLLGAAVQGLGRGTGLSVAEHLGLFMGVGLWLGQVGNSNAHELIHNPDRRMFRVGKWLFISVLFGHHTSAHRKVHHRFVATADDPNTAQLGESFYAFLGRAWPDGFTAGYAMESTGLARRPRRLGMLAHPYAVYLLGGLGFLGLALVVGGLPGLIWYVLLCAYVQAQLLLSDYVQHYGLVRRRIDPARLEPVGPQHSWNAPHWYSGALMLNAPRHSDHHTRPGKAFPTLEVDATMPMLPRSLPVMGLIALYPPAWRRIMDKRARKWRPDTGLTGRQGPVPVAVPGNRRMTQT